MIQVIRAYLKSQSYQAFGHNNIICYAKAYEGELAVIQLYTASTFALLDAGRLESVRCEIENKLRSESHIPSQIAIRFLTIVTVKNQVSDVFYDMADEVQGLWFVSEKQKQLLVYEMQSTDFFNLYNPLMDVIQSSTSGPSELTQIKVFLKILQPVTLVLVVCNLLAYLYTTTNGNVLDAEYMYSVGAITWDSIVQRHEYYRLFTSMFLHFGIQHLFSNMVSLVFLGSMLEKRLGHIRYALLYVLSGLAAGLASVAVNYVKALGIMAQGGVVSAGASGAIFGVIGGLVTVVLLEKVFRKHVARKSKVLYRQRNENNNDNNYDNNHEAPLSDGDQEEISMQSLLWMTFFSVFAGFTTSGVDNSAHVGGLVFGFILTFLLAIKR